ncbi:Retrotransposon gag domain [Sesbania bispinosa]|nr:Retrotransposon gag domain [Sesbania bispinosa]
MADGTRLSKIESELARIESDMRLDKEQRISFQERIESQLLRMMAMIEKNTPHRDDNGDGPRHSPPNGQPSFSTTRISHRDLKRDLPMFDGNDVDDWIFRLEEYFDITGIPLEQRIKFASFHMVGPSYAWYKWLIRNNYTQDWLVFVDALHKRFGTDLYTNPQEALKELKQQGTVADYQNQSEALSTRVTGLSDQWLISFFVAGLNDYLKCQLRLAKPTSYHEAVALARLHEQNHAALRQSLKPPFFSPSTLSTNRPKSLQPPPPHPSTHNKTLDPPPLSLTQTPDTSPPPTKPPYKRFTTVELRERRCQGLCYYCDEKYNPSHKCQAKCYVLLAPEDFQDMCHTSSDDATMPEISFNALSGEYSPRTLRLKGSYQGHTINILVDSGSSLNFIKPEVAQRLRIPSTTISPFKVFVGSGDFLWRNTCSSNIPILGLGRVLTDYNLLTMEFMYQGTPTTLHAEHLLCPDPLKNRGNTNSAADSLSRLTGMTPHQALYGSNTRLLPTYTPGTASVDEVDLTLVDRQEIQQQLQANLTRAQRRMQKYANSKCLDKSFEVNQWVWAKFHAYRQQSAARKLNFKLSKRYFGPFRIMERIGQVAYKLDLPSHSKIHPVLHVSLLKAYKGPIPPATVVCDNSLQSTLPTPQAIIAEHNITTSEGDQYQVLVEWDGMPREEATWESWDLLVELYTKAALEDKVLFHGRGTDTPQENRKKEKDTRIKGAPSWATDFVIS